VAATFPEESFAISASEIRFLIASRKASDLLKYPLDFINSSNWLRRSNGNVILITAKLIPRY
jgi:hypothetical protein